MAAVITRVPVAAIFIELIRKLDVRVLLSHSDGKKTKQHFFYSQMHQKFFKQIEKAERSNRV